MLRLALAPERRAGIRLCRQLLQLAELLLQGLFKLVRLHRGFDGRHGDRGREEETGKAAREGSSLCAAQDVPHNCSGGAPAAAGPPPHPQWPELRVALFYPTSSAL